MNILLKHEGNNNNNEMLYKTTNLGFKIIKPCIKPIKTKNVMDLLVKLGESKNNNTINIGTKNSKIQLKYYLSIALIQYLWDNNYLKI